MVETVNVDISRASAGLATHSIRMRALHGLSQVQAAKKIGISASTLSRIERQTTGLNMPTWILIKMATFYETTPDMLFGYDRAWPGAGVCLRCGGEVKAAPHTMPECMLSLFDRGRSRAFIAQLFDFILESVDAVLKAELAVRRPLKSYSKKG